MAGQSPPPLFQEWFGLNRNLDSHFVDLKKSEAVLHVGKVGNDYVVC